MRGIAVLLKVVHKDANEGKVCCFGKESVAFFCNILWFFGC